MAEYETDFDLTNCGYGLQYAKSKFILAKKIFHLYIYIYIYIMKIIAMSQQTLHFTWV